MHHFCQVLLAKPNSLPHKAAKLQCFVMEALEIQSFPSRIYSESTFVWVDFTHKRNWVLSLTTHMSELVSIISVLEELPLVMLPFPQDFWMLIFCLDFLSVSAFLPRGMNIHMRFSLSLAFYNFSRNILVLNYLCRFSWNQYTFLIIRFKSSLCQSFLVFIL